MGMKGGPEMPPLGPSQELPPLEPPQELDESLVSEAPPLPELEEGKTDSFDLVETPLESEMRDDTGRLVEEIRRLGADNPEVEGLVLSWDEGWERRTMMPGEGGPRAQMYRTLQIARVYVALGRIEDAIEELETLIIQIDGSIYAGRVSDMREKALYHIDGLRASLEGR